jgi:hypothetical protein
MGPRKQKVSHIHVADAKSNEKRDGQADGGNKDRPADVIVMIVDCKKIERSAACKRRQRCHARNLARAPGEAAGGVVLNSFSFTKVGLLLLKGSAR